MGTWPRSGWLPSTRRCTIGPDLAATIGTSGARRSPRRAWGSRSKARTPPLRASPPRFFPLPAAKKARGRTPRAGGGLRLAGDSLNDSGGGLLDAVESSGKHLLTALVGDPLPQAILRDGVQIVGVDHTIDRHPLGRGERYLARKRPYDAGDLSDRQIAPPLQRFRGGDDHHRAEARIAGQLRPPDFAAGQDAGSRLFRRPGG